MHRFFKLGLMLLGYAILIWFLVWVSDILFALLDAEEIRISIIVLLGSGLVATIIGSIKNRSLNAKSWAAAAMGIIYISLSLGLLMDLYHSIVLFYANHLTFWFGSAQAKVHIGGTIPVLIIFSLWINDTMAYIIGSLIGKTPLSKISPKKTWEGTMGGIILTLLVAFLVARLTDLNILHFMVTVIIVCIAGNFGDLFESKLKRMAGVKDSGHIMPGHGGFLDRFDSLLFAVPFVWLYVYFFMR